MTTGAENPAGMRMNAKQAEYLIQQLRVLLVEDNPFMRNLVRNMLASIGVKKVYEASDGIAGLEMIRTVTPDVMVLDWEMPLLNGPELVRIVRSPGVFPLPDIPIIMLTAHGERWRIVEAAKLGVNELAGVGQGAARPVAVDPAQAAREHPARRILRSGAAPSVLGESRA